MKKLLLLLAIFALPIFAQQINYPDGVTGAQARYFGSATLAASTSFYYNIQAVYPTGRSAFVQVVIAPPGTPGNGARILITWNPAPGAIRYDVVKAFTSATPASTASALAVGITKNSIEDNGQTLIAYTVKNSNDGNIH